MIYNSDYWDSPNNFKRHYYLCRTLAEHKQKEFIELITELTEKGHKRCLITDLYESFFGYIKIIDYLRNRCEGIIGIDISKKVVFGTKNNASDNNILFTVCDVRNLPFKSNAIDIIFSPSTLDHFPEIDKAIYEIHRVLKNDGVSILILNNKHNLLFVFNVWFLSLIKYLPFHTENCYSFKEIEKLLKENKFIIQKRTTLMHIPFLFPTILSFLERYKKEALVRILYSIILYIEKVSKKFMGIGKFFGWWIVLVSKKQSVQIDHKNNALRNSI